MLMLFKYTKINQLLGKNLLCSCFNLSTSSCYTFNKLSTSQIQIFQASNLGFKTTKLTLKEPPNKSISICLKTSHFKSKVGGLVFSRKRLIGYSTIPEVSSSELVNNQADHLQEMLLRFLKTYQSLTWYSLPQDFVNNLDQVTPQLFDKEAFLKAPFRFTIITDRGKISSGIDLVQSLFESPFSKDLGKYFGDLRSLLLEKVDTKVYVQFQYGESPSVELEMKDHILKASLSTSYPDKQVSVKCRFPLEILNQKDPIEFFLEEGFDHLTRLDLPGTQNLVIIDDFDSLNRLSEQLQILGTLIESLQVSFLVNTDKPFYELSFQSLLQSRFGLKNIDLSRVSISQALYAHNLLKKSPLNASEFQTKWMNSGMHNFRNAFVHCLSENILIDKKIDIFYSKIQLYLNYSKANISSRLNDSQKIIKEGSSLLMDAFLLQNQANSQIKNSTNHSLDTKKVILALQKNKLQISTFYKFPSYLRGFNSLSLHLLYYDAEIKLAQDLGWIGAKLQTFWKERVLNFINSLAGRPGVSLSPIDFQPSSVFSSVFKGNRTELGLNDLADYIKESQATLIFKLLLQQSACIIVPSMFLYFYSHLLLIPETLVPIACLASFASIYNFWTSWNVLGDGLILKMQQLDSKLSSELLERFQVQLTDKFIKSLEKTISNEVLPYHEKLISQYQENLVLAEKIENDLPSRIKNY